MEASVAQGNDLNAVLDLASLALYRAGILALDGEIRPGLGWIGGSRKGRLFRFLLRTSWQSHCCYQGYGQQPACNS